MPKKKTYNEVTELLLSNDKIGAYFVTELMKALNRHYPPADASLVALGMGLKLFEHDPDKAKRAIKVVETIVTEIFDDSTVIDTFVESSSKIWATNDLTHTSKIKLVMETEIDGNPN